MAGFKKAFAHKSPRNLQFHCGDKDFCVQPPILHALSEEMALVGEVPSPDIMYQQSVDVKLERL